MTQATEITCDGCGRDLTYTGNSVDYRIVLASQHLHPRPPEDAMGGAAVTDMMIYDPLPRSRHFCGLTCLETWIASRPSDKRRPEKDAAVVEPTTPE